MSSKSGTSSQVITLPKGGGALRGIGEKFAPDIHTGTGNFTVPVALPPGRNGFQPQISLVYSTGHGNGPLGLGWSLSMPGVSRRTSKGIPQYDDTRDTFVLSGAEDLVEVPGGPQGSVSYRPRTEGLFAKIYHYRDASNDYWEVKSKDGLVSFYGNPGAAGNDTTVIADPSANNQAKVFAWKLSRTIDPFGNRIDYVYERDAVRTDGPHQWDQLYLSEIRYIDHGNSANPQFLVKVKFVYDSLARPDPFSEYRSGFEIRTVRRAVRIDIYTCPGNDILARTYNLVYCDQRGFPKEQLPINGVSLLSQVRVIGYDGPRSEELPPLEFGYTSFEPAKRKFSPLTGPDLPALSLANPDFEMADLIGNGLPDVLEMNDTVRYWRNLGDGRFDLPREMKEAPAGLRLADSGVQMIDGNGDGRIDLLVITEDQAGYYPLRFGGLWDRRSFQPYDAVPSFDLEDPEVRLVDLDGDGVTDAVRSGSRLECFFNDPYKGWTPENTRWVERKSIDVFPDINFSDTRIKWADMSGDGLQDIVLVHDGNVEYWANLGYGNWGKRISMRNSPRFPYAYDPRRILLGDVDGDGLADLVYVDDTKVTLWINQSGNQWSDPIEIQGTPPVSDMDAVRLADMLGYGISGVLWTSDAVTTSRENYYFLDLTGGIKPYLLNEMNNHMGSVSRVGYAPSTRFYLEDEKCPEMRWRTSLPFPVQVVARVEVIDEISKGKLTTEYRYHHGYWDGAEREFRGFGRVDQYDTEVFETYHTPSLHSEDRAFQNVKPASFSAPTETRTWFHQGPIGDEFGEWGETDFSNEYWSGDPQTLSWPQTMTDFLKGLPRRVKRDALRTLRGRMLRTELYALDGSEGQDRPYTVTEYLRGVTSVPIGKPWPSQSEEWQQKIFFPHTLAERTTQWERGNDPMSQFKFTEDYDEYGQAHSQMSVAVPRKRDFTISAAPGDPYLSTYTETVYAKRDDVQRYIVDRAARTTTHEILNNGSPSLSALLNSIRDGSAQRRIIGQSLNFYDGPAFTGLPCKQIGEYGALVRTENLVLTPEILQEAYKSGNAVINPPEIPPYLAPGGNPAWTAEYPQEFRNLLPTLAGFTYQAGGAGSEYAKGYFAAIERRRYDFHDNPNSKGCGLIKINRDPLANDTAISYDGYDLLPIEVTDSVNLKTTAVYDYRVIQPKEVTDPNNNRTAFTFTPLGLLESTAVMGKVGENVGDTLADPGARLSYDFMAFITRGGPISVHTARRIYHVTDGTIHQPQRDETIENVEYSDGFGRLLQTRTQAEDIIFGDPNFADASLPADQALPVGDAVGTARAQGATSNVVVSGWQIYDNKGRVVEKYEPFFSTGWNYAVPTNTQFGQKATICYDPRGRAIRTVNPDGSEQRIIYGIPSDLTNPAQYNPTPWEIFTYDANDNAGLTHAGHAASYNSHWNTPSSAIMDALGRTIQTTQRNGPNLAVDWFSTKSTYDIRGNLLTVTDALGRLAFKYVHDLSNKPIRIQQLDAGIRRSILNASGNTIEQRDSKDALIMRAYDVLCRPIFLWARDEANAAITLREQLIYGDNSDKNQSASERDANRSKNRLGKLCQHYDEAGLLTLAKHDFKGNVLEKSRLAISDASILVVFNNPPANWQISAYRIDWQPPAGTTLANHANGLLDATDYRTTTSYDALNHIKTADYPKDVDGKRKILRPFYNRAGALERAELDGKIFVNQISYNAKGQRTLIAYGNGIMTRYAYDAKTFRVARMRTECYTNPAANIYHPNLLLLQDFAYSYDLAGNILSIRDITLGCGVINTPLGAEVLERAFKYDPLYRLISAIGREDKNIPKPRLWTDDSHRGFDSSNQGTPNQDNAPNLTAIYKEEYTYDPAGNPLSLKHSTNGSAWTRHFGMGGLSPQQWNQQWPGHLNSGGEWVNPPGNKLTHVGDEQPGVSQTHDFDKNGNLITETTSHHFEWDHSDRMKVYRTQTGRAEPSVYAHYFYDSSGLRVKKLVRKQGSYFEVTTYIDGIFEHHKITRVGATKENNALHVMDTEKRIATVRVGAPFTGDTVPAVKFYLGDHLGSSNLVISDNGGWINREEFTPCGETSFGSFAKKRYRFTGKERDEESGLYYHGARYYAAWLFKWINCDPSGAIDGLNLYAYARNNPLRVIDASGRQGTDGISGTQSSEEQVDSDANQNPFDISAPMILERATELPGGGFDFHGGENDTICLDKEGSNAKINTPKTWLVQNPSEYESTIIDKLAQHSEIEVLSTGENERFNRTAEEYKWEQVRVVSGQSRGKEGWVMKTLTERLERENRVINEPTEPIPKSNQKELSIPKSKRSITSAAEKEIAQWGQIAPGGATEEWLKEGKSVPSFLEATGTLYALEYYLKQSKTASPAGQLGYAFAALLAAPGVIVVTPYAVAWDKMTGLFHVLTGGLFLEQK